MYLHLSVLALRLVYIAFVTLNLLLVNVPNVILVPSCVCMLYVLWLFLHFSVRIPYDIIVYLFVCMIYVVWLVLDGSLCRGGGGGGGLLLSNYAHFNIMSGFDAA